MKISSLPFYGTLSDSGRNIVTQNLTSFSCDKGQIVREDGDGSYGMIYVEEGVLTVSLSGKVTLFGLHKGDVCFLTASDSVKGLSFEVTVEAETDARIQVLSDTYLMLLMKRDPLFAQFVSRSVAENFSQTVEILHSVLFDSIEQRLSAFLLERLRESGSDCIYVTHEQIARHIGSAREVITRMLKRFAGDGVLQIGRGCLTITDPDKLKALSSRSS